MKQIFTLSAMALAAVALNAQSVKSLSPSEAMPLSFDGLSISANGKYVCGPANYNQGAFIWDTASGQIKTFVDGTDGGSELRAVDNSGTAYGFAGYEPSFALQLAFGGAPAQLPMPQGSEALANGCNPDGSMVVGVVYGSDYSSHACYWKDGQIHMLPEPTSEQAGYEVNGTRAEGVSADGKIILGAIVDNFSSMPAVLWRLNEETGNYEFDNLTGYIFLGDTWEAPEGQVKATQITGTGISANGKWVSVTCVMSDDEMGLMQFGRIDTETGELTLAGYDMANGTNIYSSDVADNGTVVGFTYTTPWSTGGVRKPLMWKVDEDVKCISETYCTDFFSRFPGNNCACSLTPDGANIQGYAQDAEGNSTTWVLDLGTAGIQSVTVPDQNAPVEVYNLQGLRVASSTEALPAGLYVVRQGSTSTKILVR